MLTETWSARRSRVAPVSRSDPEALSLHLAIRGRYIVGWNNRHQRHQQGPLKIETGRTMPKDRGIRFNKMEEAIISAAGKLFDEEGYRQTTLKDIADALGLARPSLYHYYSNKEEILLAAISPITTRRTEFVNAIRSYESSPVERLTTVLREFALLISENPVWIRVLVREEPAIPEDALHAEIESRMALYNLLVEIIMAGVEDGSIRNLDENAVAYMIISTIAGIAGRYAAPMPDHVSLTSATVDVLMWGVLEPKPRQGSSIECGIDLVNEGLQLIERHKRGLSPPVI
jgi:AcrR family transcriptional regulator